MPLTLPSDRSGAYINSLLCGALGAFYCSSLAMQMICFESQPAQPRVWTDTRLADAGLAPNFDVAPDGRVVALTAPQSANRQPANQVTLVLNLFPELRLRAPR